jgi:hypothetical protein
MKDDSPLEGTHDLQPAGDSHIPEREMEVRPRQRAEGDDQEEEGEE